MGKVIFPPFEHTQSGYLTAILIVGSEDWHVYLLSLARRSARSAGVISTTATEISDLAGNLSGGEVNLAYELLNIQQSIDGLMIILSLFIIHVALVHVRIE